MTVFWLVLLPALGGALVVWLPYWYSIPRWERKRIVNHWRSR